MDMNSLLPANAILPSVKATSKRQALNEMCERASELTGIKCSRLMEVLLEREKLGSTGVDRGVAIPHGKFEELDGMVSLFARLEKPVDFESSDEQPVDLIFMLLAPETAGAEHLKALSRIARMLRQEGLIDRLRGCRDVGGIYALFNDELASNAA